MKCYAGSRRPKLVEKISREHPGPVNTIMNRVKHKDFPSTVKDVIFQANQFEPTRNGAYEKAIVSESTKQAVYIALSGTDYSQGALFFRTVKGATPIVGTKQLLHGCLTMAGIDSIVKRTTSS